MESPSLHATWTSDGRGPVTHSSLSLNRYLLQPLARLSRRCIPATGLTYMCTHQKTTQPGKERATKHERLGFSHVFAGPLLSA